MTEFEEKIFLRTGAFLILLTVGFFVSAYLHFGGSGDPTYIGCVAAPDGDLLCVQGNFEQVESFAHALSGP